MKLTIILILLSILVGYNCNANPRILLVAFNHKIRNVNTMTGNCCGTNATDICNPEDCSISVKAKIGNNQYSMVDGVTHCIECEYNRRFIIPYTTPFDSSKYRFTVSFEYYSSSDQTNVFDTVTLDPIPTILFSSHAVENKRGANDRIEASVAAKFINNGYSGIRSEFRCKDNELRYCDYRSGSNLCKNGKYGINCNENDNPCDRTNPAYCENGGTCYLKDSKAFCKCPLTHTGPTCSQTSCSLSTCIHGHCVNEKDCKCYTGYSGQDCSTPLCVKGECKPYGICETTLKKKWCNAIDSTRAYGKKAQYVCLKKCQMGSKCQDIEGKPSCSCSSNNYGEDCSISSASDPCVTHNCFNGGTCSVISGVATCTCPPGYKLPACEKLDCDSSTCIHGVCIATRTGAKCACIQGFSGNDCNTDYATSYNSQCLNGGTAMIITMSGAKVLTCTCTSQFAGHNCQYKCPFDCGTNGQCVVQDGVLMCKCSNNYSGDDCSVAPRQNLCTPNPCVHGTCDLNNRDNPCTCESGYSGVYCDKEFCSVSNCISGLCVQGNGCVCMKGYIDDACTEPDCSGLEAICSASGYECKLVGSVPLCDCDPREAIPPLCKIKCPEKCKNGVCGLKNGVPKCLCEQGFYGEICDRTEEKPELLLLRNVFSGAAALCGLLFAPVIALGVWFRKRDKRLATINADFLHPEAARRMVPDSNDILDDTYAGLKAELDNDDDDDDDSE